MAVEAIDVKDTSVGNQATEQESSAAEVNGSEEVTENSKTSMESAGEEDVTEQSNDDSEAEPKSADADEDSSRNQNAERRKQQLNSEIRDKVAERNALRREIAELNRQKYQMQNVDELPTVEALMEQQNPETGDYYTLTEAKLARIEAERKLERDQRQLDEYTDKIVDNRLRLRDEADKALKDFPMFDDESDSYNEALAEQANQIAAGLIIRDRNTGEIIGSNGSIYAVYAAIANAAQSAETSGKIAGRNAAVEMMNQADVVGSSSGASSGDADDDPFLRGFNRAN